jgi:hypothetical protein
MIPSVAWVKSYIQKRDRFQHLYKDFLKTKTTELVNKLIVDPIIEEMKREGVHEKIYHSVEVGYVVVTDRGILINIHSEYFAENGFDVALAREKGTEDHMIRPKDPDGELSWIQDGKRRFSKGHMVSGLPRLNIIQKMVERGEFELQEKLNEEFTHWRQTVFNN